MKYAWFIVLFMLCASCDYLDVKKTSSEEILNEELQGFNWNELDVYPTFSVCDAANTKSEKKQCFESELIKHLTTYLGDQHLVVGHDISDTLQLTFVISDKGFPEITEVKMKQETALALPDIEAIIRKSTDSLPKIFPALKRGQQVTSQFILPVVITEY